MCLNNGIPKNHHFPFVIKGKAVVLGVPIFKHFRVGRSTCPNSRVKMKGNIADTHQTASAVLMLTVLFVLAGLNYSYWFDFTTVEYSLLVSGE